MNGDIFKYIYTYMRDIYIYIIIYIYILIYIYIVLGFIGYYEWVKIFKRFKTQKNTYGSDGVSLFHAFFLSLYFKCIPYFDSYPYRMGPPSYKLVYKP